MDYADMLREHLEKDAACTISVLEVTLEEATRFGIMNVGDNGYINEFEEKPAHPKSTLASMGIYIFTWEKLRKYLIADEEDSTSQNDFGKNVLPTMLNSGEKMFAYRFEGYWKDVGTIDSLWEANMDLLDPKVPLDLADPTWKIYSRNPGMPPQVLTETAQVQNSMITEGCNISGKVEYSIIFAGVTVEEGAEIVDSIPMPGTIVRKGAKVHYAILAENVEVGEGAQVGCKPEETTDLEKWGIAVVASDVKVGKGASVPAKAMQETDVQEVTAHA
jgi:glucose-1-phosphate adenylyltransferase